MEAGVQALADHGQKLIQALPCLGGDGDDIFAMGTDVPHIDIGLIKNLYAGRLFGPQLADQGLHHVRLLPPLRVGGVDDVKNEVGVSQFFQRRLEGLDQVVGQLTDEANGVGDENGTGIGDL